MHQPKEILRRRAQELARKQESTDVHAERLSVIQFVLHPEHYLLEERFVKEVFTLDDITAIPGTPSFVMGILNRRGSVIAAFNLKELFQLQETGLTEFNKIMIVSDGERAMGVVTDKIHSVIQLDVSKLSPAPNTASEAGRDFIKGVTPEGLILLDAEKMLNSNRLVIDQ